MEYTYRVNGGSRTPCIVYFFGWNKLGTNLIFVILFKYQYVIKHRYASDKEM